VRRALYNWDAVAAPGLRRVQPDSIVISRAIGGTVSGNTMNCVDRDFVKLDADQNFAVANNAIATGRIGLCEPRVGERIGGSASAPDGNEPRAGRRCKAT
jgi:hypothetical protein